MDNNNYAEIESSEEFKATIKEDDEITSTIKEYKNNVAGKISNLSTIILVVGVLIGILGGIIIVSITEEFTILPTAILVIITSFVSSLLLTGLAEIIELLQSIKDK